MRGLDQAQPRVFIDGDDFEWPYRQYFGRGAQELRDEFELGAEPSWDLAGGVAEALDPVAYWGEVEPLGG